MYVGMYVCMYVCMSIEKDIRHVDSYTSFRTDEHVLRPTYIIHTYRHGNLHTYLDSSDSSSPAFSVNTSLRAFFNKASSSSFCAIDDADDDAAAG